MRSNRIIKYIRQHAVFIVSILVSISIACLYLSIAPTRLTNANFGSDGGDFLSAVLTRGIPHPTGYPTYILLGILFQTLPFSTPVFRGVLESLIPSALGTGLLTGWMGFMFGPKSTLHLLGAAITGIAWGVAPLLFSQAVIVEVHGLQSLFVVLFLWWITLNLQDEKATNPKWILVLSFVLGLGFGNHVMFLLVGPVAIFAWLYRIRQTGSLKLPLTQLLLVLAGLLTYIYLPLRAQTYPPINWGNPQSWAGFFWEVTAIPFRSLLFSVKTPEVWERIRSVSGLLIDQFGAFGLVAGVIGAVHYKFSVKYLGWILGWIFIAYFAFAIGYNTQDSIGYLIPAVMVYAIWIGQSLPAIWSFNIRHIPIGLILICILAISIGLRIPGTRARLDPRLQDQPAQYAEQLLKEAPQNAIINTMTDRDSFPIWYYHFGLHERPDLRIVVLPLTQFVWYQKTLIRTYPDLNFPAIYTENTPNMDWGQGIIRMNPQRAVCITSLSTSDDPGVTFGCTDQ